MAMSTGLCAVEYRAGTRGLQRVMANEIEKDFAAEIVKSITSKTWPRVRSTKGL